MTYKWPNSSFFNFQENANQENRRQYSCIILFNWQIGTKNLTKKKINVEPSFFTSWTITSVNAHGRTCKKTKVYIYLYISLYENLFENRCIYVYIFIYLFIYYIYLLYIYLLYRELWEMIGRGELWGEGGEDVNSILNTCFLIYCSF